MRNLFYSFFIGCLLLTACNSDTDVEVATRSDEMILIDQICCGTLAVEDSMDVFSACEGYEDWLLAPVNADEFDLYTAFSVGDKLFVNYRITDDCYANCDVNCNRDNGIPITLISVYKEE